MFLLDLEIVIVVVKIGRRCDCDGHQRVGLSYGRPAARLPHIVVRIVAGRTSMSDLWPI